MKEAHLNLGLINNELEQLDEAISSFKKAIQIDKNYAQAKAGIGSVLLKRGDYYEGLKNFKEGDGCIVFDYDENSVRILQ